MPTGCWDHPWLRGWPEAQILEDIFTEEQVLATQPLLTHTADPSWQERSHSHTCSFPRKCIKRAQWWVFSVPHKAPTPDIHTSSCRPS